MLTDRLSKQFNIFNSSPAPAQRELQRDGCPGVAETGEGTEGQTWLRSEEVQEEETGPVSRAGAGPAQRGETELILIETFYLSYHSDAGAEQETKSVGVCSQHVAETPRDDSGQWSSVNAALRTSRDQLMIDFNDWLLFRSWRQSSRSQFMLCEKTSWQLSIGQSSATRWD